MKSESPRMQGKGGFRLLELLVVFLGFNYSAKDSVELKAAAEAGQFFRVARGYALIEGADNECVYLHQGHLLRETLRGRELELPEAVRLVLGDGEHPGVGEEDGMSLAVFFADGSAQGEDIRLSAAGRTLRLRIAPVLGEARLEEEESDG